MTTTFVIPKDIKTTQNSSDHCKSLISKVCVIVVYFHSLVIFLLLRLNYIVTELLQNHNRNGLNSESNCHRQLNSRQETENSTHLDMQSKELHHVSSNSWPFDLHSPHSLHCNFGKQHGYVISLLYQKPSLYAGADWPNSSVSYRMARVQFC